MFCEWPYKLHICIYVIRIKIQIIQFVGTLPGAFFFQSIIDKIIIKVNHDDNNNNKYKKKVTKVR